MDHLVFAAEMATPELAAFMVRHTSGFICVPLADETCWRPSISGAQGLKFREAEVIVDPVP